MLHKILLCMLAWPLAASAQVPAGHPYDPEAHPNPIVTFVTRSDFHPTTFAEAEDRSGVELLGLPSDTATRESIEITDEGVDEVEILGRKTETLVYPVVRQEFALTGGDRLTLYSFRNPRTEIPDALVERVLNQHAFRTDDKPEKTRFGASARPEQLDVWGGPALLFDNGGRLTLFWQDGPASFVAEGDLERIQILRLVDDLL